MSAISVPAAIGIAGAVTAGAGIAGSAIAGHEQASATKSAAQLQSEQAANTLAFQKQVYGDTLAREQPYVGLGAAAVPKLQNYPAFSFTGVNLLNDPAYAFDLAQGQQAIQRSAAAQGGLVSGGTLKALDQYSQGYASNQFQQSYQNALGAYQQAYAQLAGQASLGQNAATFAGNAGQSAAGNIASVNQSTANALSNLYTGNANAQGAAAMSGMNALAGGVNQYANYLNTNQILNSLSGSSYGSGYGPGAAQPPVGSVSPANWAAYDAGSTPTTKTVTW